MRKKNITVLTMVICLIFASVCGCSTKETITTTEENKVEKDSGSDDLSGGGPETLDQIMAAPDDTETRADSSGYLVTWEDMADVNVVYICLSTLTKEMISHVEDAINEITETEINVHVNLASYDLGSYAQQISLLMTSGEKVDLLLSIPMDSASYSVLSSNHQLMDVSQLIEEYGKPIINLVGDFAKATSMDDAMYGVPQWRDFSSRMTIYMRKDVLEDLDLVDKAQDLSSWKEFEEILETVKNSEKWSYLAGIGAGPGKKIIERYGVYSAFDSFKDNLTYDLLGDTMGIISADASGKVSLNFATEEYHNMTKLMKEWYDKGYVYRDVTGPDDPADLMKNNVLFSVITETEYGSELSAAVSWGEVIPAVVTYYPISSSAITRFVWTIPNVSTEPEAAMTFLSMMYTDSRIANLLAWGVENVDYQIVDGVACPMPEPQAGTYRAADYLFGNQFITLPWEGQPADFREKQMEAFQSAEISPYLGFSAQLSEITNEISACSVVINEYLPSLDCGVAAEGIYDEFLQKLDKSGVSKIVDQYQRQLDKWLAEQ